MKEKILLIWKHLKQGTLKKMWKQTLWIYQYGRRYWKAMILYTLLGLVGTGVSLVSSLISRDLVDIITGHQTGKLISTFQKDYVNMKLDFQKMSILTSVLMSIIGFIVSYSCYGCATGKYNVFRNNCRKYAKCETGCYR